MHVLLIPSWYSHLRSAGGGSFFRDQAQALAAAGHKVGLIYPKLWGLRDYRAGPLPAFCTPMPPSMAGSWPNACRRAAAFLSC